LSAELMGSPEESARKTSVEGRSSAQISEN